MYTLLGSDNQQYGPVSEEDVRQWIQTGRAGQQSGRVCIQLIYPIILLVYMNKPNVHRSLG